MKRIILCTLLLIALVKINSQEVEFGWSIGDFGWSYDFIGKHDVVDSNLLRFNVSFEKLNLMITASILSAANKNNSGAMGSFYNSFLPLEISYSPFKWKYAHISVYARGAWEVGYTGDVANPTKVSEGFFGSLGFRVGLFPLESNLFKYRSYAFNVFSEYTIRNEFKLGAGIDLFDIVFLVLKMWLTPLQNEDDINYR